MKFETITRTEAAAQGRKRFYTGKPCKYGHDAQRFVTTGACIACNAARSKVFSKTIANNGKAFSYHLHPDDVAAALAYCQALDLQRGRIPQTPENPAPPPLPFDADEARRLAFGKTLKFAPTIPEPYVPKELGGQS